MSVFGKNIIFKSKTINEEREGDIGGDRRILREIRRKRLIVLSIISYIILPPSQNYCPF